MNANVKKWVRALRSGKYEQGVGSLSNDGLFCCLGVACEVAIKNGVPLKKTVTTFGDIKYASSTAYLPKAVQKWLGMKTREGKFILYDFETSLADQNDGGGINFKTIADLIVKHQDQLFKKET